jgi:hypothetical protein
MYENHAARQRAYAARKKRGHAEDAKAAKEAAKRQSAYNDRVAKERAAMRLQLREWIELVGEDGLEAAQREARKRHHPDAGGSTEDFVRLTELTEWLKKEASRKQLSFMAL